VVEAPEPMEEIMELATWGRANPRLKMSLHTIFKYFSAIAAKRTIHRKWRATNENTGQGGRQEGGQPRLFAHP